MLRAALRRLLRPRHAGAGQAARGPARDGSRGTLSPLPPLPKPLRKLVYRRGLVRRGWYYRLRFRAALSKRIRVGFGPITTGEDTLGVRKWHIDPIVDAINRSGSRYTGDIFFRREDLRRVRHRRDREVLPGAGAPRSSGSRPETRFVFDTADIRFLRTREGRVDLYTDPEAFRRLYQPFLSSMDALILSSPLQHRDFAGLDLVQVEIARPVLNRWHRSVHARAGSDPARVAGLPRKPAAMRATPPDRPAAPRGDRSRHPAGVRQQSSRPARRVRSDTPNGRSSAGTASSPRPTWVS